jgi:hypothetical protein
MTSRYSRLVVAALVASVTVTLAACSASSSTSTGNGKTAPPSKHATSVASAPKTASVLSGRWSGQYSGSYNGTFKLRWRQSRSALHGMITISSPLSTLPINGTVTGSSIKFGTVGSMAITYTGTVSGTTMSGTYQVHGGTASAGGPWHASTA